MCVALAALGGAAAASWRGRTGFRDGHGWGQPGVSTCTAPAPSSQDPLSRPPADSATQTRAAFVFAQLLATYWDPARERFFARSDHLSGGGHGVEADFWWTPQLWEAAMDALEAGIPSATCALIDGIYAGFVVGHPTFAADFTDDRGWWALAATRAFRLTGERRYLLRAEALSDQAWRAWDSRFGGGLWWRQSVHDQKNVATNAPAAMTAARLYEATGESRYLRRAMALFQWLDAHLRIGNRLADHVSGQGSVSRASFTYNEGTYIGAATELYLATGDPAYLARATTVADALIARQPGGILPDEGVGDGGGFKGILADDLATLAAVTGSARYIAFLARNADSAWASRRLDGLSGPNWSAAPGNGPIESLTDVSAVRLLASLAILR